MTTKTPGRPPGKAERWYDDACGTAHGLELIGERWSLLIVRELMFGPRRFGEIRAALPGLSANILTQRLATLERAGILRRETLPPPASVQAYGLTPWGYEAEPIIQALGRWAARSPDHDPTLPLSPASMMLSFRTMHDPVRTRGVTMTIGFRLGAETFGGRLTARGIAITRGLPAQADVTFGGTPEALAAAVYGDALDAMEAAGALTVSGDRAAAARFASLFELPPKAEPEA